MKKSVVLLLLFGFVWSKRIDSALMPIAKRVVIAFGYKDTLPAHFVGDRYEAAILVNELLKQGYQRNPLDDDEFLRLTEKKEWLSVRVLHSSVSPDDRANRFDPYQKFQSAFAEEGFLNAIAQADIVLYSGHSREGGGPDFEPPRSTENGHVDYEWYREEKKNFSKLLSAWKGERHPELLGLLSCYSTQHFSRPLQRKGVKVVTVHRLIYYAEALEKILAILATHAG